LCNITPERLSHLFTPSPVEAGWANIEAAPPPRLHCSDACSGKAADDSASHTEARFTDIETNDHLQRGDTLLPKRKAR